MLIDATLLNDLTKKAINSPRLRMNLNLHDSPNSKAQRLFNAIEPGSIIPIHRHVETNETYIVIRGKITVTTYDDNKEILEEDELDPLMGMYGVQIQKNTWHSINVKESGTIVFEVKDGPYTPLTPENISQKL